MRQDVSKHDEESLGEQLDLAERQVERAIRIITDVLDFSRSGEPNPMPTRLDIMVDEILTTSPPPENVEVIRSTEAGMTVMVDPDQLRQVLVNLITNAYQAMGEGGTLRIDTTSMGGDVRMVVADTGVGIRNEARAKIFHPFFTTRSHGTGLGLAVVHRIVVAHCGRITVDSTPGSGAAFTIVLPGSNVPSDQ
jgi:signal transduction histidine kinase